MKWPVFSEIIWPGNGLYLVVESLVRRGFGDDLKKCVIGREMACILLEGFCDYLAVKWLVFICGMTLPAGVRRRPQIMCYWP